MGEMSDLSFKAYRKLVYETDGFTGFFPLPRRSTKFQLTSPRVRRRANHHNALKDLRAIPAQAQARMMLPGWYGVGSAIEQWVGAMKRAGTNCARCISSGRFSIGDFQSGYGGLRKPTWRLPNATLNWSRCGAGRAHFS